MRNVTRLASDAVGVPHKENPFSCVREPEGASRKYNRPCRVTIGFQAGEHPIGVSCFDDDPRHVFSNGPSRLEFLHNAKHLWPEIAIVSFTECSSGLTVGLARESAGNKVNWLVNGIPPKRTHIGELGHAWPVFPQNRQTKTIVLHLRNTSHSGTFKTEIKATDPSE
jgi:hypothetical protein